MLVSFYGHVLPSLGYDVKYQQLPPKRITAMMKNGDGIDLYACGDFSRGKRPHYAYGPRFVSVHVTLYQNAIQPPLASIGELKNTRVLKQHGYGGMAKYLDPSNKYMLAHANGLISMFTHERSMYLLEFKERFQYLIKSRKDIPAYRAYEVRRFDAFLCLNKRFDNTEKRVLDIHNAMVRFQDTDKGRALIAKYAFTGRLGE